MKNLKSIIGLSFAVLLTVNIATAQRSSKSGNSIDPAERAKKQTERMAEHLSLSTKQTAQVSQINLAYAEKMHAVKAEGRDSDAAKALRTEKTNAIKAVLTAEQITKLEAAKGRKGKGRKGGKSTNLEHGNSFNNSNTISIRKRVANTTPSTTTGKGCSAGNHGSKSKAEARTAKLTEALSLSSAQVTQLTRINTAYGEKMKALKDSGDRAVSAAERKVLKDQHNTAVKAILTSTQRAKYEEILENRPAKGKRSSCNGRA